jgi:dolichol-phosphate mannosyltransferase
MSSLFPLWVILPTYNESANLPEMIRALRSLPLRDLHILVVDDNSPDGTGRIADDLARASADRMEVLHRAGKLGLGTAYISGFQKAIAAGARAIAQMDSDFSHNPKDLIRLIEALSSCDVAVGSRYTAGGQLDDRWELGRRLLSRWGSIYSRTLLGLSVRDTTAGFKVWRRETLQGMGLDRIHSNGYIFQVEMAFLAQRLGYRVCEVPILFEDRRIGHSKMSMAVKIEAAWRVWQVGWLHRRLGPASRLPISEDTSHVE